MPTMPPTPLASTPMMCSASRAALGRPAGRVAGVGPDREDAHGREGGRGHRQRGPPATDDRPGLVLDQQGDVLALGDRRRSGVPFQVPVEPVTLTGAAQRLALGQGGADGAAWPAPCRRGRGPSSRASRSAGSPAPVTFGGGGGGRGRRRGRRCAARGGRLGLVTRSRRRRSGGRRAARAGRNGGAGRTQTRAPAYAGTLPGRNGPRTARIRRSARRADVARGAPGGAAGSAGRGTTRWPGPRGPSHLRPLLVARRAGYFTL